MNEHADDVDVQKMTRDEYLDYLVDQAPEITEEQWQDTIAILALYRVPRRGGEPPVLDRDSGTAA